MKNKLLTRILAMTLIVSAIFLVGCIDKPQAQQLDKLSLPTLADNQMAVIIKYSDTNYANYTVTLDENHCKATTVEGVLQYLKDNADLVLEWHDTNYGKTIDKLGEVSVSDELRTYFCFYTSLGENGASAGGAIYTVDGVGLCYSNYGISSAKVAGKSVAYFQVESW